MARCLVLDLDGTLVDSIPDLRAALNRTLAARGLAAYAAPEVQAMVGNGARVLVELGLAGRGIAMDEAALAMFLEDYSANAAVDTRAYPGVADTLEALRTDGWTLAVCTNKPEAPARTLLAALRLDGFFAAIGGGDSFPVRKPDAGHLLATLSAAGATAFGAVMVGDHHNDIHAAASAGVASVWASWGYGVDVTGADAVAARFSDLPGIAGRLAATRQAR